MHLRALRLRSMTCEMFERFESNCIAPSGRNKGASPEGNTRYVCETVKGVVFQNFGDGEKFGGDWRDRVLSQDILVEGGGEHGGVDHFEL